ncbi:hypothetical protein GRF29_8g2835685 [Pseudopithomyces chartarum]|uniref:Uncharacterized protein n=1 Tax=Pseudopithomyces chartarum TaxID=1892770 RepID=A0AAN6RMQ1_9PLEO|nr:hypothetical protein GRF29_8g2835685 [Pseudopithomyces chartarum]
MAYRYQTSDPGHEREYTEYRYGTTSGNRNSTSFTFTTNSDEEPNVFLDLRKYFDSAPPKVVTKGVRIRSDHRKERYQPPDTDYITAPSPPRLIQHRPDQHFPQAIVPRRHRTTHPVRPKHIARAESTEYVSPWDKSDYQMIKEGGWMNQQHFMECHGLSIYEPGDFDEAKEILDDYRRVEAEAAGENVYRQKHTSRHVERHSTRSKHHDPDEYDYTEATGRNAHQPNYSTRHTDTYNSQHYTDTYNPHVRHRGSDGYHDVGAASGNMHGHTHYSRHTDRYNAHPRRNEPGDYDDSDLISDDGDDSERIDPGGEKSRPIPKRAETFVDPQYGSYYGNESRKPHPKVTVEADVSSEYDSTDAIDYSDEDGEDEDDSELGGDNFVDDAIYDDYDDDDDDYIY